jgi:uncharacterized protein YkwD
MARPVVYGGSQQTTFDRARAPGGPIMVGINVSSKAAARLGGLAAIVLVLGLPFLAPRPVGAATEPTVERDLVAITNVDRTSNGLSALIEDSRLGNIARERSDDMLTRQYFSHEIPPNGEKFFVLVQRDGIRYQSAGENIGWNTASRETTVRFVQKDFMNSPSHRANVLRDVFTSIGAGSISEPGKMMHTVLFLRPRGEASGPSPGQEEESSE